MTSESTGRGEAGSAASGGRREPLSRLLGRVPLYLKLVLGAAAPLLCLLAVGFTIAIVREDKEQRATLEQSVRSLVIAMTNDFHRVTLLGNQDTGVEIAERLRAFESVNRVFVLDPAGELAFAYTRSGLPVVPPPEELLPDNLSMWIDMPLVVNGAGAGRAQVQVSLSVPRARTAARITFAATVAAVMFLASLVFAMACARAIARPILEVTEFIVDTSRTLDTSRRIRSTDRHEIGALAEATNRLLGALEERHELEAASKAKSAFLADMSHEIRTPMTAILGFTDLLLDPGQGPEERDDCTRTIRRNGEHLLAIINDILDLSKIEAGRMTVEAIECSPLRVAEEVRSLMLVRAAAKGIGLEVESGSPVPARVRTDPLRLRQVLVNFVGNAIKFTDEGGVTLRLSYSAEPEPLLRFDVVDTGSGIPEEKLADLFQPFAQADASVTRRHGGTGLGLVISRRLAELLGGAVSVRSTPGRGSTFSVVLPVPDAAGAELVRSLPLQEEDAAPAVDAERALAGARILVAEDGPDNQRLIAHYLGKAGAAVTVVSDGRAAVSAALEAMNGGGRFDAILMDMQMPAMDGYAAAGMLRRHGWRGPIVALTAHAMEGDRQKCIGAGCSDYLTKPIDRRRLIRLVSSLVGAEAGGVRRA